MAAWVAFSDEAKIDVDLDAISERGFALKLTRVPRQRVPYLCHGWKRRRGLGGPRPLLTCSSLVAGAGFEPATFGL